MIKAPFRFDVEYFSIIVIYSNSPSRQKFYFRNQRQKELYLSKAKQSDKILLKQLKEIENRNFYYQIIVRPFLFIIVNNTEAKQYLCSANKIQDLSLEIKSVFPDLSYIYSYLRSNCNSENIKMTKNGNMIMDCLIENTLHQLKIENFSALLQIQNFEQIWNQVKSTWENRKNVQLYDPLSSYCGVIKQSKVSLHNTIRNQSDRLTNRHQSTNNRDSEKQNSIKSNIGESENDESQSEVYTPIRQTKISNRNKKKVNQAPKKAKKGKIGSSDDDNAQYSDEWRMQKTKKFNPYSSQEDSNDPTPKIFKKGVKNFPRQQLLHYRMNQARNSRARLNKNEHIHSKQDQRGFTQQDAQLSNEYLWQKSHQRVSSAPTTNTNPLITHNQIRESLRVIQKNIQSIRQSTSLSFHIADSVTQYIGQKFEEFIDLIKKQIGKVNSQNMVISQKISNKMQTFMPITEKSGEIFQQKSQLPKNMEKGSFQEEKSIQHSQESSKFKRNKPKMNKSNQSQQ